MADLEDLPTVPAADPDLPGSLELGAFSLSLDVADLAASRDFYARLGFVVAGGDVEHGYLVLRNGETTLGLFHGMLGGNVLTFNPGLTGRMERLESFTDVREVQDHLDAAGVDVEQRTEAGSSGPGSLSLVDPDGNRILVDQFF